MAASEEGRQYINPIFNLYLREKIDERNYDSGDRIFHVLLEEIPFEMLEAFAMGRGMDVGNTDFNLGMSSDDAIFSSTLADFASQLGGFCTHVLADFAPHLGANCAVKALNPNT